MSFAVLVLASGLSKRFGTEDKLMTDLKGQALLAYCLDAARNAEFDRYFIVTPSGDAKAELARSFGFEVIDNPHPEAGQGSSLSTGVTHLLDSKVEKVCVLLGDMPYVTGDFLRELKSASNKSDIVFSRLNDRNQPPAIFNQKAMSRLTSLQGDKGAQTVNWASLKISNLEICKDLAIDFDTEDDFKAV